MTKRVVVIVVGLTCLTLVAAPTTWAAPQQAALEPVNNWTTSLLEISPAIKAGWESLKAALLGIGLDDAWGKEVPSGASTQDGGTCSDPTTLNQGCATDPNG